MYGYCQTNYEGHWAHALSCARGYGLEMGICAMRPARALLLEHDFEGQASKWEINRRTRHFQFQTSLEFRL